METFLIYAVSVSVGWMVFYALYRLLLHRSTFFVCNRIYLLASLLIPLIVPVFSPMTPVMQAGLVAEYVAVLPEIRIKQPEAGQVFSWTNGLLIIYLAGVAVVAGRLTRNSWQLFRFIAGSERIPCEHYTLILPQYSGKTGSYSFLKWIVIQPEDYENHFEIVLNHEWVHVRQWHSLDILGIEILKVIFWFNPILLAYQKSLQDVHEYLADQSGTDKDAYAGFLLSYARSNTISFLNTFYNVSQLKSRITMLYKKDNSGWNAGRYLLVLPVMALIMAANMIIQGCTDIKETPDIQNESATGKKFYLNENNEQIFTYVEQPPRFPDGFKALYQYLGENLEYPEAASKAKVQGKVHLTFVVGTDGSVSDVKVMKGIGFGADEAAMEVIKKMPRWEPGIQNKTPVNVKYNLPITFVLEDPKDTPKI